MPIDPKSPSRRQALGLVSAAAGLVAASSVRAEPAAPDFANLKAYGEADRALIAKGPAPRRVVFMGDSITEFWDKPQKDLFAEPRYVNRGISGQTTSQMLLRFRQDVVALSPAAVVILAGTNDIAGNTGPITPDQVMDNILSMLDIARAARISPVLCTLLPVARYGWAPEVEPLAPVHHLNERIRAEAKAARLPLVDYFPALDDGKGGLRGDLSGDGVHPNAAGYAIMEKLVRARLAEMRL